MQFEEKLALLDALKQNAYLLWSELHQPRYLEIYRLAVNARWAVLKAEYKW